MFPGVRLEKYKMSLEQVVELVVAESKEMLIDSCGMKKAHRSLLEGAPTS